MEMKFSHISRTPSMMNQIALSFTVSHSMTMSIRYPSKLRTHMATIHTISMSCMTMKMSMTCREMQSVKANRIERVAPVKLHSQPSVFPTWEFMNMLLLLSMLLELELRIRFSLILHLHPFTNVVLWTVMNVIQMMGLQHGHMSSTAALPMSRSRQQEESVESCEEINIQITHGIDWLAKRNYRQ